MQNSTTLTITDDSGFLGIVNTDKYNSFVSEDWQLTQLFNRFVDEINNDNLILWSTGSENTWTVNFVNKPSGTKSFREFYKTLEVTNGKIFLTNYEDLTMAAQYDDEKIPAKHNTGLSVNLDNGRHVFQIRQLFDPEDFNYDPQGKVNFEIVVRADINEKAQQVDKVFWWTE
ncbi:MAG: hypothetical protein JWR61_1107 [Ferruginibacter sp.]|uniref:hypothetical protein n=1 Tax=Ferruginibacter sp. TaxID=1940288 RepID=UPI002657ABC1|nr:hypothetical protein [Ferruginibacter sp.]MDB5276152.1 hypothetical protein [Ferruginibacter sp.]